MADPIASIVVALVIAFNAVMLWRENAALLMGASPEPAFYDKVREIAFAVPGARDVHNVIAEQVGEQIHLGLHVEVNSRHHDRGSRHHRRRGPRRHPAAFDDIWVVVHVDPERATRTQANESSPSSALGEPGQS